MKFQFKAKYADYPQRVQQQIRKQKNLVLEELRKPMARAQRNVEKLTENWKPENQPNLSIRLSNTGWEMLLTNDKIFQILSAGSRKHIIKAKRGKALKFIGPHRMYSGDRQGYQPGLHLPQTQSGTFTPARSFSTYAVTAEQPWRMKAVNHPGFKSRKFIDLIRKQLDPDKVSKLVLKALRDGAEAVGL